MNYLQIEEICNQYNITNYSINPGGSIDVDGDVRLSFRNLSKLPLKFGKVTGRFFCNDNKLTSLEGCPEEVGGDFYCHSNNLCSLEGCPTEIGAI